jgi:hypothetical protein
VEAIPLPVQEGVPEGERVDCGFGQGGRITLDAVDGGYVVTIPRESVLTDTPLRITTAETSSQDGSLAVSYNGGRCVDIAAHVTP